MLIASKHQHADEAFGNKQCPRGTHGTLPRHEGKDQHKRQQCHSHIDVEELTVGARIA